MTNSPHTNQYPVPRPDWEEDPAFEHEKAESSTKWPQVAMVALLAALCVLLLVGILIGLFIYLNNNSGDKELGVTASTATTVTQTEEKHHTVTEQAPAPAAPQPQHYNNSAGPICSGAASPGTGVTSEGFAQNVAAAYIASGSCGGSRSVTTTSPANGVTYTMSCGQEGNTVNCYGGNNALVIIY